MQLSLQFSGNVKKENKDVILEARFVLMNFKPHEMGNVFMCELFIEKGKILTSLRNFKTKEDKEPINEFGEWKTDTILSSEEKQSIFQKLQSDPDIQEIIKEKVWNKKDEIQFCHATIGITEDSKSGLASSEITFKTTPSPYYFKIRMMHKINSNEFVFDEFLIFKYDSEEETTVSEKKSLYETQINMKKYQEEIQKKTKLYFLLNKTEK